MPAGDASEPVLGPASSAQEKQELVLYNDGRPCWQRCLFNNTTLQIWKVSLNLSVVTACVFYAIGVIFTELIILTTTADDRACTFRAIDPVLAKGERYAKKTPLFLCTVGFIALSYRLQTAWTAHHGLAADSLFVQHAQDHVPTITILQDQPLPSALPQEPGQTDAFLAEFCHLHNLLSQTLLITDSYTTTLYSVLNLPDRATPSYTFPNISPVPGMTVSIYRRAAALKVDSACRRLTKTKPDCLALLHRAAVDLGIDDARGFYDGVFVEAIERARDTQLTPGEKVQARRAIEEMCDTVLVGIGWGTCAVKGREGLDVGNRREEGKREGVDEEEGS